MPITALYAGLLMPLFLLLTFRVIDSRRTARVSLGTGEDPELLRRTRVHANFAEYAAFSLISLALAESLGASPYLLHPIGLVFVAGRYLHAYERVAGAANHAASRRWDDRDDGGYRGHRRSLPD